MSIGDLFSGYYVYWLTILLMIIGLYIVIAYGNLAKNLLD